MSPTVRPARPDDIPAVHRLVRALAAYEREPDAVEASADDLVAALFAPHPLVHCLVAEHEGAVVGTAVWFVSFSTWRGRHGIWLEDLVVDEAARGQGVGRALLQALAAECVRRGWTRLEWSVLDWNTPAQGFYRALGAATQDEWTTWRLDGDALAALGTAGDARTG
ncbi:GNAT family N-acetyltransferase [Aquipuribacter hungaricus]|uniref:GNAT family N-acetyltransferase n=1 Tax=Aquipuribacter hungaricus TaxID=545624 RepID=A0ABV7WGY9_9MICO